MQRIRHIGRRQRIPVSLCTGMIVIQYSGPQWPSGSGGGLTHVYTSPLSDCEVMDSNPTVGKSRIGFFIQERNSNVFPNRKCF